MLEYWNVVLSLDVINFNDNLIVNFAFISTSRFPKANYSIFPIFQHSIWNIAQYQVIDE